MRRPPNVIVFDWPQYETRLQEKIKGKRKRYSVFSEAPENPPPTTTTTTSSKQPLTKSPSFFSADEGNEVQFCFDWLR